MGLAQPCWLISGAVVTCSWAGRSLWDCKPEGVDVDKEVDKTTAVLEGAGLVHGDVLPVNLLWNEEVGGVMLIEFETAFVEPKPPKPSDLISTHS